MDYLKMKILSLNSENRSGLWKTAPVLIFIFMLITGLQLYGQQPAGYIRKGNSEYNDARFKDAEINYRKALDKEPRSVKATYNLGDALYKQGDYEKAASSFSAVSTQKSLNNKSKAATYHNLGNSLLQAKKYGESIEAYKNALRLNPKDEETRYNLAYAMTKLQQQQNNKNNQDQNKDQKQKEQQQKQQQNPEEQKQQQQPQNKQMKKQDAERMLQALNNNEKKTLDKVKKNKTKAVQVRVEKDW